MVYLAVVHVIIKFGNDKACLDWIIGWMIVCKPRFGYILYWSSQLFLLFIQSFVVYCLDYCNLVLPKENTDPKYQT